MSPSASYRILIDGYNVIMRNPGLFSKSLEGARRELIRRVSGVKWSVPVDCVKIVFDAKASEPTQHSPSAHIRVFYVPDADREIQQDIRTKPPRQPCMLISDDAELRATARSHGAQAQTVAWFIQLSLGRTAKSVRAAAEAGEGKISAVAARKITQELSDRWLRGPKHG